MPKALHGNARVYHTMKNPDQTASKTELYRELAQQLNYLFKNEDDFIANAAIFSALLYQHLPCVNWAGFYFLNPDIS